MQSNFLVWARDIIDGACSLSPMTGFPDDWKLLDGIRVKDEFPSSSRFKMDPDDPTAVMLTDSLYNADTLIVASTRLRELIEGLKVPAVEYLPVAIFNHKDRPIPEPYTIIHPLDPIDCLVLDACEPRWGRIDKTNISRLKHLVIDESRIDPTRLLFRPKSYKRVILTHRKLAEQIDAAGFTGMRWIELSNYPEG
jgi:hypothetical protein